MIIQFDKNCLWVVCVCGLCFQLKSTNPRNYVVRPRIGILLARSTCEIRGSQYYFFLIFLAATENDDCNIKEPLAWGSLRLVIFLKELNLVFCAVTMRSLREATHNSRFKDKFMIQSAVAAPDTTLEDARKLVSHEWVNFTMNLMFTFYVLLAWFWRELPSSLIYLTFSFNSFLYYMDHFSTNLYMLQIADILLLWWFETIWLNFVKLL